MKRRSVFYLLLSICISALIFTVIACKKDNQNTGRRWSPESGRMPQAGDEYVNPFDESVLVWIPGGEFYMGSEEGDPDEKPRHKVTVEGFWIGKYEVTNKQYQKFLRATGFPEPQYWDDPDYNKPELPVTGVRWYEAVGYCEWANLRLPTEAEWEYAARGGRDYEYPTANGSISHDLANYWGVEGKDTWLNTPAPVGQFPPNPYGLYDMAGNVFEWTSSLYYRYPYISTDGREDQEARYFRVMRGGSWQFSSGECRSAFRRRFDMHLRYDYVGIRVAKSMQVQRGGK
ncbi:MAG: formylglycine-generating enzyme family protein [Spirochaetes bacterium]|nr:formylglycine-generating enzyme family protein [Spirochaetota bacterium]